MNDSSHPETPPVTEAAIAEELGVKRSVLEQIRRRILTPGDDYELVHKRGVFYLPAGLEKIRAALPAPDEAPQKNGAPAAAPAGFTLIVQHPGARRTALARIEGVAAPHRAFVLVPEARQGATTLQRGMALPGCQRLNDELFEYRGPVPARLGQPLPVLPKKEAVSC